MEQAVWKGDHLASSLEANTFPGSLNIKEPMGTTVLFSRTHIVHSQHHLSPAADLFFLLLPQILA
jgi:hypothetical protein